MFKKSQEFGLIFTYFYESSCYFIANQGKILKLVQIATIHQWQYAFDSTVKMLRLVWRHLLTLIVIGMMINMVHFSTANWKNIFITFLITSFCDWAKLKISFRVYKCDHCQNFSSSAPYSSITQQNYWNADIVGTPAYLSNLGHRY